MIIVEYFQAPICIRISIAPEYKKLPHKTFRKGNKNLKKDSIICFEDFVIFALFVKLPSI